MPSNDERPKVWEPVAATPCDAFGHKWELMKADGRTHMQCGRCPAVKSVTAGDLRKAFERYRDLY